MLNSSRTCREFFTDNVYNCGVVTLSVTVNSLLFVSFTHFEMAASLSRLLSLLEGCFSFHLRKSKSH